MNRLYDQAIQAVLSNDSAINLLHMLSKGQAARRVASMIQDTVQNVYSIDPSKSRVLSRGIN